MISRMFIYLLHLPLFLHLTFGEYPLTCPSKPHWNFRAKIVCNNTENYRCLWDANYHYFLEQCEGYDIQRKGFRKVIEGDITAGDCTPNTYQPRMWTTKGNFDCEFQKSLCNDEGQTIYEDGGGITDKTCGCNHTAGYGFLKKPKNLCYCVPSEEDCTCIKQKCRLHHKVDPEYKCRSIFRWKSWFSCPIKPCESFKDSYQKNSLDPKIDSLDLKEVPEKILYKNTAFTVVAVCLVLIIITGVIGIFLYTVFSEKEGVQEKIQTIKSLEQEQEALEEKERQYQKEQLRERRAKEDLEEDLKEKERQHQKKSAEIAALKKKIEETEALWRQTANVIDEWEKDEKTFTVTRATKYINDVIEQNSVVVVTGISGSGKSSIIHHIALNLKSIGYEIIPFVLCPADIIHYRDVTKNQLFVIDDLLGKTYIDEIDLLVWTKYVKSIEELCFLERSSEQGKLKIIASCNLEIFKNKKFKSLEIFTQQVIDLQSEKYCLHQEEKLTMIKQYNSHVISDDYYLKIDEKNCQFFPLLCKISQDKKEEKLRDLFASPVNCMKSDIKNMINKKPMENCALVMCVLFPDGFHEDFIYPNKRPKEVQQKVSDIIDTYKVNLANENERAQFRKALERLDGIYVKKTGPMYSISHAKIYNVVAVECYNDVTKLYIQHANSTLLAEQFRFTSCFQVHDQELLLYLDENNETVYFERIFRDLHEKSYKTLFRNQQLKDKMYRSKIMLFIKENQESCEKLFRFFDAENMQESRNIQYENYIYTYTTTPLIEATKVGFFELVEYLIDIGCNLNKKDSDGNSPLWYCCINNFIEIVDLILKQDVHFHDDFVRACLAGKTDVVELMMNVKDVDLSLGHSKLGRTPLTAACIGGHSDIAKMLIEKGADISQYDSVGRTPLIWACKQGHTNVVEMLLTKKVDLAQCDKVGRTPLTASCVWGRREIAKMLIENGADLSMCGGGSGWTPLIAACYKGDKEIAALLIEKGADLSVCESGSGWTPLIAACYKGDKEVVEMLIKKGANPLQSDKSGDSPLDYASDDSIKQLLIHHKN